MKKLFSSKLTALANRLPKPLYAVGGAVRDFLIDGQLSSDIDLASPTPFETLSSIASECGIHVVAEYKRTGTVILHDGERKYEFTSFRRDVYGEGGFHLPHLTVPTDSIMEDAKRRDFKCNAVYYDIKNGEFCDPLGGILNIKNKTLSTVKCANEVFSHDGLRLMRLARFSGELNFKPDEETLLGAKNNCDKIKDVSVERIFAELKKILFSDSKHSFSDKEGHYTGLKILEEIGVLEIILPDLYEGKGMAQRSDYHKYDVLEHSLRTVLYADRDIRLSALLHDVAKPLCFSRDGNFYMHTKEGEKLAKTILKRLKASNEEISKVCYLTKNHMLQVEEMREEKLRLFIADNYNSLDSLIKIKEADFRALKDEPLPKEFLKRFKSLIKTVEEDGTPITVKDLKVSAKDLMEIGMPKEELSKSLKELRYLCINNPTLNQREKLLKIVQKGAKNL